MDAAASDRLIYYTEMDSPVGGVCIGVTGNAVCFLDFIEPQRRVEQLALLETQFRSKVLPGECGLLAAARRQLTEYFACTRRQFDLPLAFNGTGFQAQVWNALIDIPYGSTCSYADIACRIGNPKAMRAVGAANGRNHIPIIVPCHRVVNADGSLGGFSSGLWRKRKLLALETAQFELVA